MTPFQETLLHKWASTIVGQPFSWGQRDCNTITVEWIDMLTRTSYADHVIGKYSTKNEAKDFYSSGVIDESVVFDGWEEINPLVASVGDVIVLTKDDFPYSHICVGSRLLSVDRKIGGLLLPFDPPENSIAWRFK